MSIKRYQEIPLFGHEIDSLDRFRSVATAVIRAAKMEFEATELPAHRDMVATVGIGKCNLDPETRVQALRIGLALPEEQPAEELPVLPLPREFADAPLFYTWAPDNTKTQ